jgi:hypothetical protein
LELQLQALTAHYVSGDSTRGRALLEVLAREAQLSLESRSIGAARGGIELFAIMVTGLPYLRKRDGWLLPARGNERDAAALRVHWGAAAALTPIDGMASCQFAARALALAARTGDRVIYGQALALHVALVPAGLNYRSRGNPVRAVSQLTRAAQAYDTLGMQLHAASARLLLGGLPARDAAAQSAPR